MPADAEELSMAVEDGVEFKELLAPVKLSGGTLLCQVMRLADPDESGRRGVAATGETMEIPADTVIAAVGEKVDTEFLKSWGIEVDSRGRAVVDEKTLETSVQGVYVAGDNLAGPATVVEAMRDAKKAAEAILKAPAASKDFDDKVDDLSQLYGRRGILEEEDPQKKESGRCLGCSNVCEACVEVCPNRANVSIEVPGMARHQVIHVDYMCNECGNCRSFCPYDSAPYLDKFTLFATREDYDNSTNQGFLVLDPKTVACRVRYMGQDLELSRDTGFGKLPEELWKIIETVCRDYPYLLGSR